jgi:hypothetical protein
LPKLALRVKRRRFFLLAIEETNLMKNIVGLGLILSAGLMFAACSSDSDSNPPASGDAGAAGETYASAGAGAEAGSIESAAGAGGEGGLLGLGGAPVMGGAGETAAGTGGAR